MNNFQASHGANWAGLAALPTPGSIVISLAVTQVLLAFFQRGDDFDFLARNCLFRVPFYAVMANGDRGQGWTFEGLAAYFASGAYGNTPQATRLALSAFSTRIEQLP